MVVRCTLHCYCALLRNVPKRSSTCFVYRSPFPLLPLTLGILVRCKKDIAQADLTPDSLHEHWHFSSSFHASFICLFLSFLLAPLKCHAWMARLSEGRQKVRCFHTPYWSCSSLKGFCRAGDKWGIIQGP